MWACELMQGKGLLQSKVWPREAEGPPVTAPGLQASPHTESQHTFLEELAKKAAATHCHGCSWCLRENPLRDAHALGGAFGAAR